MSMAPLEASMAWFLPSLKTKSDAILPTKRGEKEQMRARFGRRNRSTTKISTGRMRSEILYNCFHLN